MLWAPVHNTGTLGTIEGTVHGHLVAAAGGLSELQTRSNAHLSSLSTAVDTAEGTAPGFS